MKREFANHRLSATFPDIQLARSSARRARIRKLLGVSVFLIVVGIAGMLVMNLRSPSHLNLPKDVPGTQSAFDDFRNTLKKIDNVRSQAIEYRDIGLIHEYADNLSPVFIADSKLIRSLIESDIQITNVAYVIENVEVLSLRRSGNSEYVRLLVQDSRSAYQQRINEVTSIIPARARSQWNVELFRRSKNEDWTLWSVEEVIKPLPQ